jgi:AbrB family looped-hinge helix DNA binding protein
MLALPPVARGLPAAYRMSSRANSTWLSRLHAIPNMSDTIGLDAETGCVMLGRIMTRGQVTVPRAIRRAVGLRPGDVVSFRTTAPDTVELKVLPRLSLAEALERYRIDVPIDEARDREQWQKRAAEDVFGESDA